MHSAAMHIVKLATLQFGFMRQLRQYGLATLNRESDNSIVISYGYLVDLLLL
jgi:hypothetical protein